MESNKRNNKLNRPITKKKLSSNNMTDIISVWMDDEE
jgi:hypothetical protein